MKLHPYHCVLRIPLSLLFMLAYPPLFVLPSQFIVSAFSPELDALEMAGRLEEAAVLGQQRVAASLKQVGMCTGVHIALRLLLLPPHTSGFLLEPLSYVKI